MVSTPLVKSHVRLSPHVPLAANDILAFAITARKNVNNLCFISVSLIRVGRNFLSLINYVNSAFLNNRNIFLSLSYTLLCRLSLGRLPLVARSERRQVL